ncbi:MAG: glutamate racemase [Bdellovibrionales bacterium]|jgi:glutamate racemase|nr:glutamate racemase [Bdellovibrionales bacterium]
MKQDSRPIGFFDSGIGGLTVLRTVRRRFPGENFIYLGDTARLPYGTKSPETIWRYTQQSISALRAFDVKAVVVACNSASTALLAGRSEATQSDIPIYNVIEPGAQAALAVSEEGRIGVLGTRATVLSNAYVNALLARRSDVTVFQQAAPLLVPLVEEGWEEDALTNLIIFRYLTPLLAQRIDTLILGCTHYPALRLGIERVVGSEIRLVDSSFAIADILERAFQAGTIDRAAPGGGGLDLYATDRSATMDETARRLMGEPELPGFQPFDL